jgi:hypothetical protein
METEAVKRKAFWTLELWTYGYMGKHKYMMTEIKKVFLFCCARYCLLCHESKLFARRARLCYSFLSKGFVIIDVDNVVGIEFQWFYR